MTVSLSEEELASRSGTTVDHVRRLVDLGILPSDADSGFLEELIPRTRLALHLEASGVSLEDVEQAIVAGSLSLSFADRLFGRPIGILDSSPSEFVAGLEMSGEFFTEVQITLGMPGEDGRIREDDAELLRNLDRMLALGLDERTLARFFQVVVDNLHRIAVGGREMWLTGVEEPLLAQGLSHAELLETMAGPAPESQLIGEAMVQLLWNRFIEEVIFQAGVEHLETALEEAGVARRPDPIEPAIAFLDLTGYTNLTERFGDEAAAESAQGLAELGRPLLAKHSGRLVKMLGDGAMLHFPNPTDAVRCGIEMVASILDSGMPPARLAITAGPLILRDADFYGRTVNIAARLVDYARPQEVLVTENITTAQTKNDDILYQQIGPVSLRGVPEPVVVYTASAKPSRP